MIQIYQSQELGRELGKIIDSAEHSIRVSMYQLSPDATTSTHVMKALWQAIRAAPARGLKCSAILGASLMAAPGTMSADRSRQALEDAGWLAICDRSARVMHAKTAVFDAGRALVGSHNWTGAALSANTETSVLINDEAVAVRLAAHHDEKIDALLREDDAALAAYRAWSARLI